MRTLVVLSTILILALAVAIVLESDVIQAQQSPLPRPSVDVQVDIDAALEDVYYRVMSDVCVFLLYDTVEQCQHLTSFARQADWYNLGPPPDGGWDITPPTAEPTATIEASPTVVPADTVVPPATITPTATITPVAPIETPASPLVTNIQTSTGNVYALGILADGAFVFVDRTFTFTNVLEFYLGHTYILTANDDKAVTDSEHLRFTLSQAADVYVAIDIRAEVEPTWLDETWALATGELVATDTTRRIYSKTFAEGEVVLGGNGMPGNRSGYVVIVVALESG